MLEDIKNQFEKLIALYEAAKAENESLRAEVAKLKKTPASKPAHQEVADQGKSSKTGNKGLDRLSRIMSAK